MISRIMLYGVAGVLLLAQEPPKAPPPAPVKQEGASIRVQVNEVIVPVTVTDERGRFVSNLEKQDFQILDDGVVQNINYFSAERLQPVVIGFLIDLSNANRLHWDKFQTEAIELVDTLLPGDPKYSGYLIGYNSTADLLVDTTSDPEKIVAKIRTLKPAGGSALNDALYIACTNRKLIKGEPIEPRRVVIIIGDGHDNASKRSLGEVLELAQRNLITVFGISTTVYGFTSEDTDNLIKLAEETGGRVEYPMQGVYKDVQGYISTPKDEGNYEIQPGTGGYQALISSSIFQSIANIAGEITTQYILRYIPAGVDSQKVFRPINVKVALPNVKVRARKGYYPNAP